MAQTVDVASMSAVTKRTWPEGDMIWDQFSRKQRALDMTEMTTQIPFNGRKSSDGNYFTIPVATQGHANPAVPTAEKSGLPNPGRTQLDQIQFNLATMWQSMEITGESLDNITGGEESVVDALTYQMRNQPKDAGKETNRWMHGDGSGVLAVPSNVGSGNTITVDSSTRMPEGREFVMLGDTSGSLYTGQTSGTALKVSAVNSATSITCTDEDGNAVSLSNGAVSNYSIYAYPGVQGGAINGFALMCSVDDPSNWGSGTPLFGNVSRATNDWWKGYQTNASGGTVSVQQHIQPHINRMCSRGGQHLGDNMKGADEGVTWYAFTGYQNFNTIANALASDQRTMSREQTLRGGYKGINYMGAALVVDDDAPPSRIRFIHYGSMRRFVRKNWFWNDRTGSIWTYRNATDGRQSDVYIARMYTRQQNFVVMCLTMGEIYNTSATF